MTIWARSGVAVSLLTTTLVLPSRRARPSRSGMNWSPCRPMRRQARARSMPTTRGRRARPMRRQARARSLPTTCGRSAGPIRRGSKVSSYLAWASGRTRTWPGTVRSHMVPTASSWIPAWQSRYHGCYQRLQADATAWTSPQSSAGYGYPDYSVLNSYKIVSSSCARPAFCAGSLLRLQRSWVQRQVGRSPRPMAD
jgi:hypothetical protein